MHHIVENKIMELMFLMHSTNSSKQNLVDCNYPGKFREWHEAWII
jgi:hypothetical protein